MKNTKEILIELIAKWLEVNNTQKMITKYLYDHTELFENQYESDYNFDLYQFFSGKCTRYSKDHNKLMELLDSKQKKQLRITQLLMR